MSVPKKDRLFVGAQFILMIIYVIPLNLGYFYRFKIAGITVLMIGAIVGLDAIWQLRHSISPFPSPKANADLIKNGVFRWVRHPIYTGIFAVTFGYAIYSGSIWKGIISVGLLVLFQFKARYEEQLLLDKFDQYSKYMAKTGRFLPKLLK